MEVVAWYLENANGAESHRWYVPLTDFSDVNLVVPLFSLLAGRPVTDKEVFDRSVYRDPRLGNMDLWDGSDLLEIKRVNPDLIRLLAEVKSHQMEELVEAWFASKAVQDFYGRGTAERSRREVDRILRELVPLARQAVKKGQDVLQKFWWCTA